MEPNKQIRKPKLNLPFDNTKGDVGEWTYDNRIGICVTVIAYLILAISFVAGKIVVGERQNVQGMYIDLKTLDMIENQRDIIAKEVQERQKMADNIDWRKIQNLVSNENAQQRDEVSGQNSEFTESGKELQEVMDSNREAYQKGLAEEQAILNSKNSSNGSSESERQDSKIKGSVTVSFSLTKPIRTSRHLTIPAYLCEGGGEVVVEIVVNCNGRVASADIISGGDNCMRETALSAAKRSRFNIDNNAPPKQTGTITYIFIPQ